jgi:trehalose/maltose hydrolase-like predicted phosphorylase
MAQWNLECAAEAVQRLSERRPTLWTRLARRLGLGDDEPDLWRDLARRMYTGFDSETGRFEQFAGYFGLEDIDLREYGPHAVAFDMLLGRDRVQQSQVIKQADVVMLVYLLWDRLPPEVREANFRYYEPRTGHGSSLSPAIHAAVAARLGDLDTALRYFRQASGIDFADNMGNAAGGIHAAALGGLWQAAVFGFAGMRLLADGLAFQPHCPPSWRGLRFPVRWRGRRLRVQVRPRSIEIAVVGGATAVPVRVGDGPVVFIPPGKPVLWEDARGEGEWQEVSS